MKSTKLGLLLLAVATLGGICAHATEHESGGRLAPLALSVEFLSQGQGISIPAFKGVMEQVSELALNSLIDFVTVRQSGLEGEKVLCIRFKEWSDIPSARDQLQSIARIYPNVSVSTLLDCPVEPRSIGPTREGSPAK